MHKIYLAGAMSGLIYEKYNGWREEFINSLKWNTDKVYSVVNPVDYYNFETISHESEREVMEFDLWNLKQCDIVVVNFNKPDSIGTAMELAVARNEGKIIIGLNEENKELHPWLIEHCTRIFTNMDELIDYVIYYFLSK